MAILKVDRQFLQLTKCTNLPQNTTKRPHITLGDMWPASEYFLCCPSGVVRILKETLVSCVQSSLFNQLNKICTPAQYNASPLCIYCSEQFHSL
jgi:hypothetical protein